MPYTSSAHEVETSFQNTLWLAHSNEITEKFYWTTIISTITYEAKILINYIITHAHNKCSCDENVDISDKTRKARSIKLVNSKIFGVSINW